MYHGGQIFIEIGEVFIEIGEVLMEIWCSVILWFCDIGKFWHSEMVGLMHW